MCINGCMKIQMHIMHSVYTWSHVFVYMAMYDAYQTNGNCDLSYVVIQQIWWGFDQKWRFDCVLQQGNHQGPSM